MKKLIFITFAIFIAITITSCIEPPWDGGGGNDPGPDPMINKIVGNWDWIYSTGNSTYEFKNPETEGYHCVLIINKDKTYEKHVGGIVVEKGTYVYEKQFSYFRNKEEWTLVMYPEYNKGNKRMTIMHVVEFPDSATLNLIEDNAEGYTHTYHILLLKEIKS